jgi:hypothetical protein
LHPNRYNNRTLLASDPAPGTALREFVPVVAVLISFKEHFGLARASRKFLLPFALTCRSLLLGYALPAQEVTVNLATGPRDVLYAQSQLLRSIDQAWFADLSPDSSADSPLPIPLPAALPNDKPPKESEILLNTQEKDPHKNINGHFRWGACLWRIHPLYGDHAYL